MIYIHRIAVGQTCRTATSERSGYCSEHLELLQKYETVLEKLHLTMTSENFQISIKHPLSSLHNIDSDYEPIEAEYVIIRKT